MWGLREPDGKTGTTRLPLTGEMARTGVAVSGTAPLPAPSEAQGQSETLFVCWTN